MKKNKFKKSLIFLFIISMLIGEKISAFEQSFSVNPHGNVVSFNGSSVEYLDAIPTNRVYPAMQMKNSTAGQLLCLTGFEYYVPTPGSTCTYSEWTTNEKYGIAYIINLIESTNGIFFERYYWKEVIINQYLGNIKCSDDTTGSKTCTDILNNNSSIKVLNTNKNVYQIVNEAKSYAASNPDKKVTITANGAEMVNLTFTKNTDGYYYSEPVTISSNFDYNLGNISNNKFSYDKNGDKYIFKIKESDIAVNSTETFKISAEAINTYIVSSKYDCPGENVQDVTLDKIEKKTNSASITINGAVSKESISFKLKKIDSDKKPIEGTGFMIQTESQKNNGTKGIEKRTDNQGIIVFDGLSVGTYYITETVAKEGFLKDITPIKVVIDKDGNLIVNDVADSDKIIEVVNSYTSVLINKIDGDSKKSIAGAKLQLLDINKKEITCTQQNSDGTKTVLQNCTWTSTEKPIKLMGLVGTYYLKELESPKGYTLNSEMVKILIAEDGNIYVDDKLQKGNSVIISNKIKEVEVPNTLSSRSALLLAIAMFDIALGIGIVTYVKKNKIKE